EKNSYPLRNRLTKLVVIACLAMFGIICMQGYWLANFYHEKKATLLNDVESAMLEVHLKNGTSLEMGKVVEALSFELLDNTDSNTIAGNKQRKEIAYQGKMADSLLRSM